ncbi:PA14 domain-containing protein [Nonomuraea sp. NPDC000554]|uniref:MGH1-like glycoside hydrolase domain-containing protein n=1 Tax=Nonomuraea sp. NPDC000554 TaxID=3154259 RepID=UPI003317A202
MRIPAAACAIAVVLSLLVAPARPSSAEEKPASVLDHGSYLAGFNDPGWYEANIPFVDLPDRQIQEVYYYRWRVWKEHLRYTNPADGWVLTEFLDCCGYAAPYQAINAAAGHHIYEGRWVRDRRYLDDYVRFWLTGPGQGRQQVNPNAPDWAHEYSFWAADAVHARAEITGDWASAKRLLPALIRQYDGWQGQFDAQSGLYWQLPVWDAKELSPASYQSSDTFGGVRTLRPSINAYQYGDAVAISRIAAMTGDGTTARRFAERAATLKRNTIDRLWDARRTFFYDVVQEDNPGLDKLDTREDVGFVPWQFHLPDPAQSAAWQQLLDPQGFAAPYGPTTVERRSRWFMHEASQGCCRWTGPSWPYTTAQVLTGMGNLLTDYPAQPYVSKDDYYRQLRTYALTQYRDGKPYVAEAHHPDEDRWLYDGRDHSEDYLHSTYTDLVLSGLLGLRGEEGATLRLAPLVPAAWDHFAVENVPYHGHDLTVLWDRDGSHYGRGAGLRVYVDGSLVRRADSVRPMTIPVGPAREHATGQATGRLVNDAANPLRTGFPKPIASFTSRYDNEWNGIDGKVWFDEVPQNTRWTNYTSPNTEDYYGVDFGDPTRVGDISWYGYDDGGGVRTATAYRLQHWTGTAWQDVPGQVRSPDKPVGNGLNRITFPEITTSRVRLLFGDEPVGVVELQAWSRSSDAMTLTATPGKVVAGGTGTVTTTLVNQGHPARDVAVRLTLPAGWTARPLTSASLDRLKPGGELVTRWSVTPPADASPCQQAALTAEADYTAGTRQTTRTRASLDVTTAEPRGLRGEYYLASAPGRFDFAELKATVVDPAIDFADLNPVFDRLTGRQDDVTVRWTGQLAADRTGDHTFSMIGDNGFRLWVDGRLVIDHWVDDWDVEQTGSPVRLEAGRNYDIKIEYFEHYGGAHLRLRWQPPGSAKETVPACSFHPPA